MDHFRTPSLFFCWEIAITALKEMLFVLLYCRLDVDDILLASLRLMTFKIEQPFFHFRLCWLAWCKIPGPHISAFHAKLSLRIYDASLCRRRHDEAALEAQGTNISNKLLITSWHDLFRCCSSRIYLAIVHDDISPPYFPNIAFTRVR